MKSPSQANEEVGDLIPQVDGPIDNFQDLLSSSPPQNLSDKNPGKKKRVSKAKNSQTLTGSSPKGSSSQQQTTLVENVVACGEEDLKLLVAKLQKKNTKLKDKAYKYKNMFCYVQMVNEKY